MGEAAYGTRAQTLIEINNALINLRPDYPKMYTVADLRVYGRRRWVATSDLVRTGRLDSMYKQRFSVNGSRRETVGDLCNEFVHGIVGRVVTSFAVTGRAWDPGLENLKLRTSVDGGFDWAGVFRPDIRVLPSDPAIGRPNVIAFPSEGSVAEWLVTRTAGVLNPLFDRLHELARCDEAVCWAVVGSAVIGASNVVALGRQDYKGYIDKRVQAVLDAYERQGYPVRLHRHAFLRWIKEDSRSLVFRNSGYVTCRPVQSARRETRRLTKQ